MDGPDYVYEGEILSVKITLRTDATVSSVTLNGTEMSYNAQTQAYEAAATEDCEVRITFNKAEESGNQSESSENETQDGDGGSKGCSKSDAVLIASILGTLAASVFLLRK